MDFVLLFYNDISYNFYEKYIFTWIINYIWAVLAYALPNYENRMPIPNFVVVFAIFNWVWGALIHVFSQRPELLAFDYAISHRNIS